MRLCAQLLQQPRTPHGRPQSHILEKRRKVQLLVASVIMVDKSIFAYHHSVDESSRSGMHTALF